MEYALARGVSALELDLAVTSDDVLVLSHDPFLLGTLCVDKNGAPAADVPIRSLTLAEVQAFDCGSTAQADFPAQVLVPGTPPPTLAEVIALGERRSGGTVRYNIELKMDPAWGEDIVPSANEFVDLLERVVEVAGVGDRVIVQSFDARPLVELERRNSPWVRSLLIPSTEPSIHITFVRTNPILLARHVGAEIVSPYGLITRAPLVDAAHAAGLRVIPWTINERDEMERVIALGVDGIISDDVDLMLEVVNGSTPTGGLCPR